VHRCAQRVITAQFHEELTEHKHAIKEFIANGVLAPADELPPSDPQGAAKKSLYRSPSSEFGFYVRWIPIIAPTSCPGRSECRVAEWNGFSAEPQ